MQWQIQKCRQVSQVPARSCIQLFFLIADPVDPQWFQAHSWTLCGGPTEVAGAQEPTSHRPHYELFFHSPGSVVECASQIAWLVTLNSQLPIPYWTSSCPALSLIVWDLTPVVNLLAHNSWWSVSSLNPDWFNYSWWNLFW